MENLNYLRGKQIAISISESEEINQLGFSDKHQTDAMTEFARHFLVQEAMLVYGGDLRNGGYTELFADLSEQYKAEAEHKFYFKNYFFYPLCLKITKNVIGDFREKNVEVVLSEKDNTLGLINSEYFKPDSIQNKYYYAKCITKMRKEMNAAADARIVLGGRNTGFLGKYPGIIEEAQMAIDTKKPTYLIGAFGGATLSMINAITNKNNVIEPDDAFYRTDEYQNFKSHFNANSQNDKLDIEYLNNYFKGLSFKDLNNGLNEDDNNRLFTTPHIPEAIFLVLKGLKNCL